MEPLIPPLYDPGFAGNLIPAGRLDRCIPVVPFECCFGQHRLGYELHNARARHIRTNQAQERGQAMARRFCDQRTAGVQIGPDAGTLERLIDQRPVWISVSVDDRHPVKGDAFLSPFQAGSSSFPYLSRRIWCREEPDVAISRRCGVDLTEESRMEMV